MHCLFKWIAGLLGIACILGLAVAALFPFEPTSASDVPDAVAPYFIEAAYPMWRSSVYPPEAIPLDYVQQIGHVFILPGENGTLAVPAGFVMPQLIERVHAANRKILIGVGGASSHDEFVLMVSDPTDRATFVQNLTGFVIEQGYDGVEIDWEFPRTAADRENLNALMTELRASLDATGQDLLLDIAVSASEWSGQWIDVDTITPLVDYYLVMTYSYHGGWSARSGHNAPLYPPPPGVDNSASVHESIRYWTETRGVPGSQIVMGLASYGISFDSEDLYRPFTSFGQAYYCDIRPLIGNGYTRHWDSTCQVPYLTQDDGPTLWSYDDPESIGLKCDYVIENNLGGVAIWDVTGDLINGHQELLEAVADKLMPQSDIILSATPDNVTIRAGQSAIYTLSVTASGSVTGAVALALHNQPAGTSATFDINPVDPPGTSLLTITNTTSLSPATYVMAVTGICSSLSLSDSVSISLVVTTPCLDWISVTAANESASIYPGETATYTLSLAASAGFTAPVTLTVQGAPSGTAALFDPNPLIPPGTSQLYLTTTASTGAGTYALTVTGTSGVLTDVVSVMLIVTSVTPGFTLSIFPTTHIAKPDQVVSYTVVVTGANGFSQPVTLTVVGLPIGVYATWSINPAMPGRSSILTLFISSSSPFGVHPFQVVGTAETQIVAAAIELIIDYPFRDYLPIVRKSGTISSSQSPVQLDFPPFADFGPKL